MQIAGSGSSEMVHRTAASASLGNFIKCRLKFVPFQTHGIRIGFTWFSCTRNREVEFRVSDNLSCLQIISASDLISACHRWGRRSYLFLIAGFRLAAQKHRKQNLFERFPLTWKINSVLLSWSLYNALGLKVKRIWGPQYLSQMLS